MARPLEAVEISELTTFLSDEMAAKFGSDFDADAAEDGLTAIATAVVKWQRYREDNYLEVSTPNVAAGAVTRVGSIG